MVTDSWNFMKMVDEVIEAREKFHPEERDVCEEIRRDIQAIIRAEEMAASREP